MKQTDGRRAPSTGAGGTEGRAYRQFTAFKWSWDDELSFMRSLGPHRLSRYVETTRRLRVYSNEWWAKFEETAKAAAA